jgi:hypothetical protein
MDPSVVGRSFQKLLRSLYVEHEILTCSGLHTNMTFLSLSAIDWVHHSTIVFSCPAHSPAQKIGSKTGPLFAWSIASILAIMMQTSQELLKYGSSSRSTRPTMRRCEHAMATDKKGSHKATTKHTGPGCRLQMRQQVDIWQVRQVLLRKTCSWTTVRVACCCETDHVLNQQLHIETIGSSWSKDWMQVSAPDYRNGQTPKRTVPVQSPWTARARTIASYSPAGRTIGTPLGAMPGRALNHRGAGHWWWNFVRTSHRMMSLPHAHSDSVGGACLGYDEQIKHLKGSTSSEYRRCSGILQMQIVAFRRIPVLAWMVDTIRKKGFVTEGLVLITLAVRNAERP